MLEQANIFTPPIFLLFGILIKKKYNNKINDNLLLGFLGRELLSLGVIYSDIFSNEFYNYKISFTPLGQP